MPVNIKLVRPKSLSPLEIQAAARVLADGFYNCDSKIVRYQAWNDYDALLDMMSSCVAAGLQCKGLFLAYELPADGAAAQSAEQGILGTMIVTLPGSDFDEILAKSFVAEPSNHGAEAQRSREWANQELEPWFKGFLAKLPAGFMSESLYISLFAVPPALQGQGIGTQMLNTVLEFASDHGLTLSLFNNELSNMAFYGRARLGVIGKDTITCDGQVVTWWAMKRIHD